MKAFSAPTPRFWKKARRVFEHHFPTTRTGNELSARRPVLSRCAHAKAEHLSSEAWD
jgi:hypothetical protein